MAQKAAVGRPITMTGRGPRTRKPRPRKKWAVYPPVWLPFAQARAFVRTLGLRGKTEWEAYRRGSLAREKGLKPEMIPAAPDTVYANRWVGWGDWLGTGTIAPKNRRYKSFEKARSFVRALNLGGSGEWFRWSRGDWPEKGKRPLDIPSAPWDVYRNKGWRSMGDWLGTGIVSPQLRLYWPFRRARAFVRALGLRSQVEWVAYAKGRLPGRDPKPDGVPVSPERVYAHRGWGGLGDWIGTGTVAPSQRRFRPFREARAWARSLKLRSSTEWERFSAGGMPEKGKRPGDIPSNPSQKYRGKGWKGYKDWLGNRGKQPRKQVSGSAVHRTGEKSKVAKRGSPAFQAGRSKKAVRR